jgi:hypothetical protein
MLTDEERQEIRRTARHRRIEREELADNPLLGLPPSKLKGGIFEGLGRLSATYDAPFRVGG